MIDSWRSKIEKIFKQYASLTSNLPARSIEKLVKDPVLEKYSADVLMSNIILRKFSSGMKFDWYDIEYFLIWDWHFTCKIWVNSWSY